MIFILSDSREELPMPLFLETQLVKYIGDKQNKDFFSTVV